MSKAVVMFSGGLDSTTVAAMAKADGFDVHAINFDYHSGYNKEIELAPKIAEAMEFDLVTFPVDMSSIKHKSPEDGLLKGRSAEEVEEGGIPDTYSPARNTVMMALCLAYAESIDADAIFTGFVYEDSSGYPDTTPEFVDAFQNVMNAGTKRGVEGNPIVVYTPIIHSSKEEIISIGLELKVPYELTWSCYDAEDRPCLECDSCLLRARGFRDAGTDDPVLMPDEWQKQLVILESLGY